MPTKAEKDARLAVEMAFDRWGSTDLETSSALVAGRWRQALLALDAYAAACVVPDESTPPRVGDVRARLIAILGTAGPSLAKVADAILAAFPHLAAGPATYEWHQDRCGCGECNACRYDEGRVPVAAGPAEPDESDELSVENLEFAEEDHLQAVRFLREEDADRAIMGLPNGWHLIGKPVEHAWLVDAVAGGGTDG